MFERTYLTRAIMQEREREIQKILLSRIAGRSHRDCKARTLRRLLASLGALLCTWGQKLEQRYGESPASVCA